MNSTGNKLSFIQISMMLMLTIGLTSHVIVNPMILDASGRDAWISVIITGLIYCPWCGVLLLIMKKSGQQKLQPWLAQQTTPLLSWILMAPFIAQLYLMGGMTVLHTSIWTVTNYLPATPKLVLITVLTLVCQYAAKIGIRAITIASGILLPTVVLLGFFVAISNVPEKNYQLLKPYLEHGWQLPMNGMIYAGSGFVEIVILLFMQHHLKSQVKYWMLLALSAIIVGITLGPVIGAITEFGPQEAAKQMTSPYEQWRLVKLGDYIEHVDFLSVYQWLSGSCVRISLSLFLLGDVLPITTRKGRNIVLAAVTLSYISLSMLPINQNDYYLWTYRYYFPGALIITLICTTLWAGFSLWTRKTKEKPT